MPINCVIKSDSGRKSNRDWTKMKKCTISSTRREAKRLKDIVDEMLADLTTMIAKTKAILKNSA
jgi:uncharacterized iron-regulated protein